MQLTLVDNTPDLLTPPNEDREWEWWSEARNGLSGKFEPLRPHTGFYRFRQRKSDRGEPCQIWFDLDRWWCVIGDRMVEDVGHAWRFAHGQPISWELYEAVRAGAPWPDEQAAQVETPTAGHNSAQPEAMALDEIAAADAAFAVWLNGIGGAVRTEEQDQVAKGYDDRIARLRKDAETARKAEKDAYLRAGQAIDEKWRSVKDAAVTAEGRISEAVTPFRIERKRRADEAARIEREARVAAYTATGELSPRYGTSKPTGLRKTQTAVVSDPKALAEYLVSIGNAELLELLVKLSTRLLKAGAQAPGARLVDDWKA